ncbi:hypothetical protein IV203_002170 [Nitzschia inconspicua]|uniref:Uncharacterized protein n=1 Tax=Nitzschia inconspicua TaxID=303405 RepID=A0A9K3L8J8_9STRA|nr:hypothetical protein IV203_002170 [Nitzschia inconspicua]
MKFSNQALERLNRMVSMKILAGPTRFNDIESMYSASKGEEACSSDMVAQVIDDPSIGPQSVFVDWTKHEDFIIDTGVTQHFVPEMLDYDTHDILNSNRMQVTGLASSVGQVQGSSVTTLEHAFAVNNSNWTHVHSRNKKRNAQLGPPRPEGSDAGRNSFDMYMCRDAGLYTYRLNGRNILKSNSVPGQRNGLPGLPPRRIKKPFATRRKINGTWVTVLKHPNNMITIAKTGEIIRTADLPRNPSMTAVTGLTVSKRPI